MRRALRAARRHPSITVGAVVVAAVIVPVVLAPWLAPHDPAHQELRLGAQPPWLLGGDLDHPLGTDRLGRDLLSRVMEGGRVSLMVAVLAFAIQASIGATLGMVSGYIGGRVDQVVMRLADLQLALPGLVALLAAVAIFGASLRNLVLFLGVGGWPAFARIVRSEVLSIRERDYIQAVRSIGATRARILVGHVLPNVATTIAVVATLNVPATILAEASLSFLGLGVPPDTPTWGSMTNDGRAFLATDWWIAIVPGLAIGVIVLGINLLGDGLRDLVNPRLRRAR